MFYDDHGYTPRYIDTLWDHVVEIHNEAGLCGSRWKDENAWIQVVRSVFKMGGRHPTSKDLELNSV